MKVKKILSRRSLTKQEDKDQRRRRSNRMKSLPDEDAGVVFWEDFCDLHEWHRMPNRENIRRYTEVFVNEQEVKINRRRGLTKDDKGFLSGHDLFIKPVLRLHARLLKAQNMAATPVVVQKSLNNNNNNNNNNSNNNNNNSNDRRPASDLSFRQQQHPTNTSPTMRPAPFNGLPHELQVMIFSLLYHQQDVLSCTLVSHKWHEICNSILWNDVSIYWYTSERPLLRSFTATGSLKKYGHHIQILEMEYGDECMQNFLSLAPEIFSQLQSIELNGDVAESDGMVADLLWRCSQRHGGVGLRQFVMECGEFGEYGMYFCFGSKSFEALMDHVSTLEVFRVEAPCSSSKEIQQLLCSAPRLRVFNILSVDRRRPIEHGTWLDASDVHTDWACTSLKVFGCPIGGVPRPDIKRKLHNRDASDFVLEGNQQESITLQKQVYRQLARLTDLRELRMGIPYYTEDPSYRRFDKEFDRQYDCLSMSLESGLDLLSGLKGLRVVALEDMEVAIDDKRETRWVAQNWPRAEVLSTDCGSDRDEDSQLSGDDERDSYDELSYGWQEDYDNDNY